MAHQPNLPRIVAFALSAVVVTGSMAGLGSYSNAKYADAHVAAQGRPVAQPTVIAPLRIDVVGRRIAA